MRLYIAIYQCSKKYFQKKQKKRVTFWVSATLIYRGA